MKIIYLLLISYTFVSCGIPILKNKSLKWLYLCFWVFLYFGLLIFSLKYQIFVSFYPYIHIVRSSYILVYWIFHSNMYHFRIHISNYQPYLSTMGMAKPKRDSISLPLISFEICKYKSNFLLWAHTLIIRWLVFAWPCM